MSVYTNVLAFDLFENTLTLPNILSGFSFSHDNEEDDLDDLVDSYDSEEDDEDDEEDDEDSDFLSDDGDDYMDNWGDEE